MKKLRFVYFILIAIFLLVLSVFSFNVNVKAWDGWDAPQSAKNYAGIDGKGMRFYILEVFEDVNGNVDYANMVPVKNYVFFDGILEAETDYKFGRNYFDSDLIDGWLTYYLDEYGSGNIIYDWDRTYVYFNVEEQVFYFEYHGNNYAGYMLEQYLTLYDELGYGAVYDYGYGVGHSVGYNSGYSEGYDVGYDEGYDEGYDKGFLEGDYSEVYEEGFKAGQKSKMAENNEKFYNGIEKWLVPAIITVIALGGFVTIAARKRREE
jgi:hypothetical protein